MELARKEDKKWSERGTGRERKEERRQHGKERWEKCNGRRVKAEMR